MDFEFYRNFIITAETGNLSTAAKRLNIVQPALSAQIKALEKNYGVQLFKMQRGKRHIELTEAGKEFLQQVKILCSTENTINLNMQTFSQQSRGILRFGVSHVRSNYFLQKYLIPFAKRYPNINYQFYDATVAQQQKQLETGLIDFAFANAPLPVNHEFSTIKVQPENFYVCCLKDFVLPCPQNSCSIPLSALNKLPLCCNYGSYNLLRNAFEESAIKAHIAFIATTAESAITFASSGLGVAVVPLLADDALPNNMKRLHLTEPALCFEQMFYWYRKNRMSPPAEIFLEFFKSIIL